MSFLDTANEEVDYLEVDTPLPGQNYVCLSFISPDKVLEQKDSFVMKEFIKSLEDSEGNINIKTTEFNQKYEDFTAMYGVQLDEKFHKESGFQTSMRGIKVRGVYSR